MDDMLNNAVYYLISEIENDWQLGRISIDTIDAVANLKTALAKYEDPLYKARKKAENDLLGTSMAFENVMLKKKNAELEETITALQRYVGNSTGPQGEQKLYRHPYFFRG